MQNRILSLSVVRHIVYLSLIAIHNIQQNPLFAAKASGLAYLGQCYFRGQYNMAAITSKECAVHFVGSKDEQLKSFSSKTFEKLITLLRKRWTNLSNNVGNVCRNSYQIISENQFTRISNEGEKESFANGYYYHM